MVCLKTISAFFLLTAFTVSPPVLNAQRINISEEFTSINPASRMKILKDSTTKANIYGMLKKFRQGAYFHTQEENYSEAFDDAAYWFKIDCSSDLEESIHVIAEVGFSDLNELRFFIVRDDSIVIDSSMVTGDYYPFDQRPLSYRNFIYPFTIPPHDTTFSLVIRAYVHGEPLVCPIVLWEQDSFFSFIEKENLLWGFYFCFIFMFIVLAFIVWIMLKSRLNLYYLFYLIFLMLFLIATTGTEIYTLWPRSPFFRNIDGPVFIGALCVFALLFAAEFLELRKNFRRIYYITIGVAIFTALQTLLSPVYMSFPTHLMQAMQFIYLSSLAFLGIYVLVIGGASCIVYRKKIYFLYFGAYSIVSAGFIVYFLEIFDVLPDNTLTRNLMYINAIFEMLIFSSYLTHNMFQVRKANTQMRVELAENRAKATLGVLAGEEKERIRLSRELHDGLGLSLSLIKTRLTELNDGVINKKDPKMQEVIDDLELACRDVRNLSHDLSPLSLEKEGLIAAVKSSVDKLNSLSSATKYIFKSTVEDISILEPLKQKVVYRICQELLNNAFKYANAGEVFIGFDMEDNTLYLNIRDNGVGFDVESKEYQGIGFMNIRSRLVYLGGKMEIKSIIDYGTLITVEIPV